MGVMFFWAFPFFFFLIFSVSSASSKRVCKKTIFIGFLHTLKHLVTSCNNNQVKPKLPKKKVHNFFSETPFLTKFFFKNTNFAPPPENCAPKNLQKPLFYRLKKGGQVIDPTLAKLLTLLWPKCGQVVDPTAYIYMYIDIYIYAVKLLSGPSLALSGVIIWSKVASVSGPSLFFLPIL